MLDHEQTSLSFMAGPWRSVQLVCFFSLKCPKDGNPSGAWVPAEARLLRPLRTRSHFSGTLGSTAVPLNLMGLYTIYNALIRFFCILNVEKDRFIDRPVFLFYADVIHVHEHVEPKALDVGFLQGQGDVGNLFRGIAIKGELVIVAITQFPELLNLIVIARDQRSEFAPRHTQIGLHGVQRLFGGVQVSFGCCDILGKSSNLLCIRLQGNFFFQLLRLLLLLLLELRNHGTGPLQLATGPDDAFCGALQLLTDCGQLLRIVSFKSTDAARELILKLSADLLARLSLLSFQSGLGGVNLVDSIELSNNQSREDHEN